jgi:sec-independent protein translocase protein TatA
MPLSPCLANGVAYLGFGVQIFTEREPVLRHGGGLMDFFSIWHWLIVGAVLLLLFGGRGKISDIMGDVAKGIKAFKVGIADTTEAQTAIETPASDQKITDAGQHSAEPGGKT